MQNMMLAATALAVAAMFGQGAQAASAPWVMALDKAQGAAPLVLVVREHDGKLTGDVYVSPNDAKALTADLTKLAPTETTLKGEITVMLAVGKTGAYTLDATLKDGVLTGTYTGTTGDDKVTGAIRSGADLLPLGHALFLPSATRPVGFRGDGTGVFPGAMPVTAWEDKYGTELGKNVLWKTAMPGWTTSSPVVVGNKVFTVADPDLLVCADVTTGAILWQKQVDHLVLWPADEAKKAREQWKEELALYHEFWTLQTEYRFLQGPVDPKTPALKLGDLDARKARLAAISKEKGFVYAGKEAGYDLYTGMYSLPTASTVGYEDRNQAEAKKHVALRGELYAKYGFNYEQWRGWLGNTYRTPISDGACVFVAMAYGQVACYDLDGDLKWMQWLPPGGKDHTWRAGDAQPAQECGHTPSPILVGDRLIVQGKGFGNARNTGRNNRVVALDKRTGKVLWEYNTKSNLKRDVGAPVAMTVNGVELVVLSTGVVLQATDGKVLSEDVIAMPGTRIGCMATNGDQVFFNWCASTDGQREKNFIDAFRFTYGAEGFSATRLWTAAVPNCDRVGSTLADGTLYTGTYALYTVNAADGVVTQVLKDQKNRRLDGNTPPSVAGGKVYWVGGQSDGGRVIVSTAGTNASTIGASTIVCDARFDFDKAKRGTMPLDDYLQKYGGDKDRFPTVFAMCGGPFFQGDRMYLRSAEYLYCIGTAPKTDGK